jgi:membrane protein implicated in regulation of membrane protease activity
LSPPRAKRTNPLAIAVATVLLLAAIGAAFWVPLYARTTPKLGAFPFFYWYQLILVPAVAIVSWLAYLCLRPGASRAAARAQDADSSGEQTAGGPEAGL